VIATPLCATDGYNGALLKEEWSVDKFKGALMVGALRLFALLPWRAVQAVGGAIGWLTWKLPNRSREIVRINLAKCFPELDAAARERLVGQSMMDIGRSLTESACAWIWPADKSLKLVREVQGLEILEQALASGKGVVGITSHLGNWEVLNHFYCMQCKPIIFYRPPKLKAVDELLQKQRVQLGNRVAASTKEGILSVIKEVRKGGQVGIPADPEPAESAGVFVPFLGTQALTSKFVPNMLAGGKAVGVFLHALRLPDGSGFKVILEAAPEAMYSTDTQTSVAAMSEVIAKYVRAYPSQYMWSMKRFKKRPAGEDRWY
jgi:KDO2-lipid IV(A) lauroyltransferase